VMKTFVMKTIGFSNVNVGFTLVDLKKLAYHNDPFIMVEQAK